MTISYVPSKDEMLLKFCPLRRRRSKQFGRFRLWWDDEGDICGIRVMPFMEELKDFEKKLNKVKLGGIWKDARVSDKDIKEVRGILLTELGEKW